MCILSRGSDVLLTLVVRDSALAPHAVVRLEAFGGRDTNKRLVYLVEMDPDNSSHVALKSPDGESSILFLRG